MLVSSYIVARRMDARLLPRFVACFCLRCPFPLSERPSQESRRTPGVSRHKDSCSTAIVETNIS